MLQEAASVVPAFQAWVRCLQDDAVLDAIRKDIEETHAKPTDRATIRCDGWFAVEDTTWHDWWDVFRRSLQGDNGVVGRCLVTGVEGPIATTHPKVSGMVSLGGNSTGSVLVSFDKPAFSSYGLEQGANAPINESVAAGYQSALNDLMSRGIELAGMKGLYWYKEAVPQSEDPLFFLGAAPSDEVQEMEALEEAKRTLNAPREPQRFQPGTSDNRFYLLLVSAVSARIMVRAWYEGTYDELKGHVEQWFQDTALVRRDGTPGRRRSLYSLLKGIQLAERDWPAPLVRSFWEAAILDRPIPRPIAVVALERVRHDILRGEVPPEQAIAVLKVFVTRTQGRDDNRMTVGLDPNRPEPAYHLGRLLALISRLQQESARDRSSNGWVSRYYAAMSMTPALMVGRLLQLSEHYYARMGESRGLEHWFRMQIADVMSHVGDIPRTFSLEEQALFALGFYHQLAHREDKKGE
jgi:CRISPR-associated protein Csd1